MKARKHLEGTVIVHEVRKQVTPTYVKVTTGIGKYINILSSYLFLASSSPAADCQATIDGGTGFCSFF